LVNRINVQYYLKPLRKSQTIAYIDHRLKSAGVSEKIFDAEAKNLIHDYSGGSHFAWTSSDNHRLTFLVFGKTKVQLL
jgi:type II secretory pathway predicted ATPase ExeA